ncbi:GH25 family lysozyme [Flammeovirgaceae bacterium SG7u.111]|nr:GH25 family lysozyme [Flammeovirgaceae bacterium SG7u.132]WPO36979.1 GH25 family lysozyme [Flammeovirgaceae bacterium SG7u.111]
MRKIIHIVVVIGILVLGYTYINHKATYEPEGISIDKEIYPVTGLDLSHHSGKVDFAKLKNDNIDFVYLKASEGADLKDKNLEKNYQSAHSNSVRIGFYHFFKFNTSPIKQAQFYLSVIEGKTYEMPLVIDVEDWGNNALKSQKQIRRAIEKFINYVEKQTGCKMIIYTNLLGFNSYIKGVSKNKIWLCSFRKDEKLSGKWLFWQHSHKGKLAYVEGWADINTFNGSREEFEVFLANYCN